MILRGERIKETSRDGPGSVRSSRIVTCPKGGRVPEGYCLLSCLNYSRGPGNEESSPWQRIRRVFLDDGRPWLQVYKDDIASGKHRALCEYLLKRAK